ncbi:helix-turn-helix transcriptional regulator [Ruegeria sp. SCPT10]|uniref:helix-turn-helix domain-containing protein n=1 Tax=Ruegeria sp. SCP10 TaxID=3141377 RepID=UPI00333B50E0
MSAKEVVFLKEALSSEDVYGHVGQRLRGLRSEKRMTQAEVARLLEISPQQYQKYEDAQSKCSLPYLMKLAAFYQVPIESLLPQSESSANMPSPTAEIPVEADLLARLVSSFVKLSDVNEKLRLVQLVEAIVSAEQK